MPSALVLVGALLLQTPAPAQPPDPVGEAYFLFLQSRRFEDDGKVPEAISSLRRAIALVPKAAELHAELAGVFAREGRAAESVTSAEAALAIEPRNREANRTLAFVKAAVAGDPAYAASSGGMVTDAIRHLEVALSNSIVDLSAQLLLAKLYSQTAEHEKALSTIRTFLNEQPGYPEALLLMGESAEKIDRWEDAADAWSQIVEMGPRGRAYLPRQAIALVKLGDQYFQLKRYKDSAAAFDRALAGDRTAFDVADVQRRRDRARELAGEVIRRAAAVAWLALLSAGCGHTIFVPPSGPGVVTDASEAWTAATAACKGAQHYSAALKISGRAGSQRIWHLAIDTAVTPTHIYMGATFSGQPVFVLAGSAKDATLWLRREQRAVKAPAGDIIEAILGLPMPPDRLLSLLTGCATRSLDITAATTHNNIVAVQTADARVFLERQGTAWRTRGAEAEGFRVEFLWKAAALPEKVWIRSTPGREPAASLDVSVTDPTISDPIPASVFNPPSGAAAADPMTIDELRSAGSWRKKS